jgi:two-component system sensor kinase FixL
MENLLGLVQSFADSLEWLPVGVLVYDTHHHKPLGCNTALLKQFEALDKKAFLETGPFSSAPSVPQPFDTIKQYLAKHQDQLFSALEIYVRTKTNALICFEVTVSRPPVDASDYLLITFNDITKRKGVQGQLVKSRNTMEAIISTAVDGIIIINRRGIVQLINQAAQKLFGYSDTEVINQNVNMLMPEPHRTKHDSYLDNYHQTRKPRIIGIGREVDGKKKDGTLFPLRLAVSAVKAGPETLYVGVIHDLTEQKKAEQKIINLNRELEQKVEERTEKLTEVVNRLLLSNIKLEQEIKEKEAAEAALLKNEQELKVALEKEKELNELKSRFVAMASHEFRTPLTTIASSAELVGLYTEHNQQDKRLKHLKRIQSAVTNLTGILGDFLSLSKLEEGKIHSHPVSFKLDELLHEAVEDMASLLKPGQRVVKSFQNLDQEIWLDKKLLKNICINLLSNAIKYSGKDSNIWFDAYIKGQKIYASIKDEGIGIPEEDQKHLFSRFFRADNAMNIQGTGLGLNIVKRYIDLLKGAIRFESVQGEGTVFYFEIQLLEKRKS